MKAVAHYREAERHLEGVAKFVEKINEASSKGVTVPIHMVEHIRGVGEIAVARAQVHATLALAGATALQAYTDGSEDELEEWAATAGDGSAS